MPRKAKTTRSKRNNLGTITQEDGRWRAFYRYDGHRYTPGRTFPTKTKAVEWLTEERADRARGTWTAPVESRPPLPTLAEYYETYISSNTLAASTERNYHQIGARWILPRVGEVELGPLPLDEITPPMVRAWFAAVKTQSEQPKQPQPTPGSRAHPARRWAQAQGITVAPSGKLPLHILAQWKAAGSPTTIQPPHPAPGHGPGFVPGRAVTAQAYRFLHAVMESAKDDGIISSNPCQIKGASYAPAPERTPATPEQVQEIAEHMPDNLKAAVYLAAWSGLRRGELFALARKHVDLDNGIVRVERSLAAYGSGFTRPKTLGSVRDVALPAFIADILAEHMASHTGPFPDSLVFPSTLETPLSSAVVNRAYKAALEAVGCQGLHWHDLRHTGATLAYSVGATVRDVQARLGHMTTRAAMIYAHRAEGADRRLADALDAAYSPHAASTTVLEANRNAQRIGSPVHSPGFPQMPVQPPHGASVEQPSRTRRTAR